MSEPFCASIDAGSAFTNALIYCSASFSSPSTEADAFPALAELLTKEFFAVLVAVPEAESVLFSPPPQAVIDRIIVTAKIPDRHTFLFLMLPLLISCIIVFHI